MKYVNLQCGGIGGHADNLLDAVVKANELGAQGAFRRGEYMLRPALNGGHAEKRFVRSWQSAEPRIVIVELP